VSEGESMLYMFVRFDGAQDVHLYYRPAWDIVVDNVPKIYILQSDVGTFDYCGWA